MDDATISSLVHELTSLPHETEWVEFKRNYSKPDDIGKYLSGISNSAAMFEKRYGYVVWGIADKSHDIVGTRFKPKASKVGGQELESWLTNHLDPRLDFRIYEAEIEEKRVVIFEVPPAKYRPTTFKKDKFIRIGSYLKRLADYPEKEKSLWRVLEQAPFETGIAKQQCSADEIFELLDYPTYFHMTSQPLPDNRESILNKLISEKIIGRYGGLYDIFNVGAILFARQLSEFSGLSRKALRVIVYDGKDRLETVKEQKGGKGYALGFQGAISYISDLLPENEQIVKALRKEVRMFPDIAIRELIANALIHQDFSISGAGPMVEIFSDRMEITNPGPPLIDTLRLIDEPPRSRNEDLASLMRRMGVCEERGSGIDKVITAVEAYQLPAPDFRVSGSSTIAVLYGPRKFAQMDRQERIRACYQHACLQFVAGSQMSNASLRKRLGIKDSSYPVASRIIRDTKDEGLIKPRAGGSGSARDKKYIPFWA